MSIESAPQAKTPSAPRTKPAVPDGPPDDWRAAIRLANIAVLLAFLALTFLLGAFPLKDTDFWWHLRTGDIIRETWKVPQTDIFLWTREGAPWIDLHWMFQVAISLVYHKGGVVLLNLAKCAVTTVAVFFLITARRRDWPMWVMALAWLPSLLVLNGRMYVRPETLSLLYLSLELAIIARWHRYPRLAWLLPVVQLFWANSHGLFVLGLIVIGFALIDAALRRGAFAAGHGAWWKTILGASFLTAVACLINPYGLVGAIYPIELASTMNNPIFSDNIAELKPIPTFLREAGLRNVPMLLHFNAMIVGALSFLIPMGWQLSSRDRRGGGLGIAGLRADSDAAVALSGKGPSARKGKSAAKGRKKGGADAFGAASDGGAGWRLSPFRVLLYVAFSLLSLKATRNSHQFAAIVGTVTAWNFGEWAAAVRRHRDRLDPKTASGLNGQPGTAWLAPRLGTIGVIACLFVLVAGGWFYDFCGEKRIVGLGEEPLWFPHEAAKFAGSPGMPERFIAFHIGHVSLLEYYNGPEKKSYADARLEVVGPQLFRSYLDLENEIHPNRDRNIWEAQLERLGRPSVLVEHEMHGTTGAALLASPRWKCVWFDLIGAVFVHDSYAEAVSKYEVDFASRHFRKSPESEPRTVAELLALAKAARTYLNALPPEREKLTYPFIWAGLDAALRVLKEAPNQAEAWKYLGQIEFSREQATSGIAPEFSLTFDAVRDLAPVRSSYALSRALEMMPEDFTTIMGLSNTFTNRRILSDSKRLLETVRGLYPINLAQADFIEKAKGLIKNLDDEMGPAPSLEWDNPSELDQVISKLIRSGRIRELAELLERAYPLDRATWEEIDRLAVTRLHLGEPAKARELWNQAKAPGQPGLRQARIAATYLAEEDFDRARVAYREAIAEAPGLFEAHYGLAVLEQDAGNADEASDQALMAWDLAKNNRVHASAARALAARVSGFLTRPSRVPALKMER